MTSSTSKPLHLWRLMDCGSVDVPLRFVGCASGIFTVPLCTGESGWPLVWYSSLTAERLRRTRVRLGSRLQSRNAVSEKFTEIVATPQYP
jgi:hypothetical protein